MLQFAEQLFGVLGLTFNDPITVGTAFKFLCDICLCYLLLSWFVSAMKSLCSMLIGGGRL